MLHSCALCILKLHVVFVENDFERILRDRCMHGALICLCLLYIACVRIGRIVGLGLEFFKRTQHAYTMRAKGTCLLAFFALARHAFFARTSYAFLALALLPSQPATKDNLG